MQLDEAKPSTAAHDDLSELPPPLEKEPTTLIEEANDAEEKRNGGDLDDAVEDESFDSNYSKNSSVDEETAETEVKPMIQPYRPRQPPKIPQEEEGDIPDYSQYKTNVAERLWRAKKEAKSLGATASPDIVPLAKEYQLWRKKMGLLNKYIDEYKTAMNVLSKKRSQLFVQYAKLSENTPLFKHVGEPLTPDQMSKVGKTGEGDTPQSIESRTKSIMEVADKIGAGSLLAHQQLSLLHEELNQLDFENHIVGYIDEWDKVVTSQLDDEVRTVRELAKNREKYIDKVDKLRQKVNSIEHRGKQDAPKKLTDQLNRNEAKLEECDVLYEKKANEVSVVLYEATARGWVDFYPVIKNVMKFEINRLGRESSTFGSFHSTLEALKIDYKQATKDTADAPNTGSAL